NKYSSFAPPLCAKSFKGQVLDSFFKEQNNMIDILNLLCACPGQIPRYSGLEYQSYYFAL
ncbi:MAG: hypothetical protein KKD12_01530, partial [Proteobacteria bacterium]|nr:hypothetical protein [Pseudomonadota bacterium]